MNFSSKTPNVRTETRTIKMSHDNFESAIITWLYAIGAINDNVTVIGTDFGLPVDENGNVEFDIEVVV